MFLGYRYKPGEAKASDAYPVHEGPMQSGGPCTPTTELAGKQQQQQQQADTAKHAGTYSGMEPLPQCQASRAAATATTADLVVSPYAPLLSSSMQSGAHHLFSSDGGNGGDGCHSIGKDGPGAQSLQSLGDPQMKKRWESNSGQEQGGSSLARKKIRSCPSGSSVDRGCSSKDTSSPKGVPEKLGAQPLRLIIVGHNPSAHAWQSGHYYSNPSNHMWRILAKAGIAPAGTKGAVADDAMPAGMGVGFLDVGCGFPGTDSSSFSAEDFRVWSSAFYARLSAHMQRASRSIGKRQYLELLNLGRTAKQRAKSVEIGLQLELPSGWPFPASTEVWVMPSTSGASALTTAQREGPYILLGDHMRQEPWPRRITCLKASSTSPAVTGPRPVPTMLPGEMP